MANVAFRFSFVKLTFHKAEDLNNQKHERALQFLNQKSPSHFYYTLLYMGKKEKKRTLSGSKRLPYFHGFF